MTSLLIILSTAFLLFIILLFLRELCFAGPALPPSPLPAGKIIDLHCHVAGIGAGDSGCFVSSALRNSWRYRIYLRAFGVSQAELLCQGDQILIERLASRLAAAELVTGAVILALDAVVDERGATDLARTEVYIPNDFVAAAARQHDNLYYGASVNPYRPEALALLDQAKKDGAVLLKWLPAIQLIDPSDQRLTTFYLRLKELELPLLTHTGHEHSFSRADNRLGDPQLLRLPLSLGVTVIAAHAACSGKSNGVANLTRLFPLIAEFPTLYADISSLTQLNKLCYLAKLLSHPEVHDRLLYGTDMPLLATPVVSPFYFACNLPWRQMLALARVGNPWDQDLLLKQALGVPGAIFSRGAELLRIGPGK